MNFERDLVSAVIITGSGRHYTRIVHAAFIVFGCITAVIVKATSLTTAATTKAYFKLIVRILHLHLGLL